MWKSDLTNLEHQQMAANEMVFKTQRDLIFSITWKVDLVINYVFAGQMDAKR